MKRRTIIILAAAFAVLGLGTMAGTGRLGGKKTDGPKAVPVVRGTLVDRALAVGTRRESEGERLRRRCERA